MYSGWIRILARVLHTYACRSPEPLVGQATKRVFLSAFEKLAAETKCGCPVFKLLKADITLDARLLDASIESEQAMLLN